MPEVPACEIIMSKRSLAVEPVDYAERPAPSVEEALAGAALDGAGSLTHRVCRLLRGAIVKLLLMPNQFLSEKDVAACLRISKTPVREAFIRLAEDGLVSIVPKSGTYVSPIDAGRLAEGFFVWAALEGACAGEAARRCGMDDIGRLRALAAEGGKLAARGDAEAFVELDARFRNAIMEAADMEDSEGMMEAARFEVDRVLGLCGRRVGEALAGLQRDHEDLVNAVVNGDGAAAKALVERRVGRWRDVVGGESGVRELCGILNARQEAGRRRRG